MALETVKAEYIEDYKIRLEFSDNTERVVDFKPFLEQSKNPMTTKYLDKEEFRKFKIEYGDLTWNDYELCFPTIDLYDDNILKSVSHAA
ncbi:MAG: DUF2442 domain-containing protein [Candidatus Aminicenantes bacterium]|nr:DUF2442 domain-containing protein [Candidatus Aminicenantes bacterium]